MPSPSPIAIVTGAGSGIGAAISVILSRNGYQVIAVGRRIDALRQTVEKNSDQISARALDVTECGAVQAFVSEIVAQHGRIDVLVNSAGTNTVARSFTELDPDEWDRILRVNATGAFNCMQQIVPIMRESKAGTIVNISSVAGLRSISLGGVAYNASKFAMTALGKTVGEEEKHNGIRVTNIYPGEVETPILDARPVPVSSEHRGRILQPEDIAEAVLLTCKLPLRARISDLVMVPTTQTFV